MLPSDHHMHIADSIDGISRRKFLAGSIAGVTGAAALATVGCGGGNSSSNTATATQPQGTNGSPNAQSTATQQAKQGGTWNQGAGGNIALATLPFQEAGTLSTGGSAAANPPGLVWGQLVRIADDKLDFIPDHAKEWQLASDGTSIKFVIRNDIYFHSGRQFTTKDIAFGLEQLKNPKWAGGTTYNLNPVASYNVIDDFTMEWMLKPNTPTVLPFMSVFRMVDQDTFDQIPKGVLNGTGAFKWTSFDPVRGATLQAYDKYHLGRPFLDKIQVTIFADATALATALETGEIDDSQLSPEQAVRFYSNSKFDAVKLPAGSGMTPITCRTDLDPTKDKRVRQAIGFLLDRKHYQDLGFLAKDDELGRLPWPTVSPAYDKALDQPVFDPSRAKTLLKEAGFPNGLSTPIKLDTLPIRAYAPAIAQLLQQQGKEVGLNFVFEPLEYNSMLDRFYKGQLDNLWVGFGDASSGLSPAAAIRASSTIGNDVITHASDPTWVAARDAIRNGASTPDAYKQFNNAYLDQSLQFPLSRAVPVDFQSKNIHISRNYLGGTNYYKVWKG